MPTEDELTIGQELKRIRLQRKMTLEDLSNQSDVSKSLLSQIERNISVPTVITLERITKALGIATSDLFLGLENGRNGKTASTQPSKEETDSDPLVEMNYTQSSKHLAIVRKEDRKKMILPRCDAQYELLSPDLRRAIEFITVRFPVGAKIPTVFGHAGEECGVILKGRLRGYIGDKVVILEEGDSIYLDSSVPHRWENIGDIDTEAIWAITPPSF